MRPIVNVPEEDRATDIGNMHKKLVKIVRVVPEISSRTDRQTHRHTYSSQYFATALACKVTRQCVEFDAICSSEGRYFAIALNI